MAIQLCREVKYPEQTLYLKLHQAQVIFHLNNNQDGVSDWEYIYKTRAYENQVYFVSINPTHENQKLFSYVVSPEGKFLLKTESAEKIYYINIDLENVSDKNISQRRVDLLDLIYKGK